MVRVIYTPAPSKLPPSETMATVEWSQTIANDCEDRTGVRGIQKWGTEDNAEGVHLCKKPRIFGMGISTSC